MTKHSIYTMSFAKIYNLYVAKAKRKGRNQKEVDEILCWFTGHTAKSPERQIQKETELETFLKKAPKLNPLRRLITGSLS